MKKGQGLSWFLGILLVIMLALAAFGVGFMAFVKAGWQGLFGTTAQKVNIKFAANVVDKATSDDKGVMNATYQGADSVVHVVGNAGQSGANGEWK